MFKNANSKYYLLLAIATALPIVAVLSGLIDVILLMGFLSAAALAGLFYIKPSAVLLLCPAVTYGAFAVITGDLAVAAISALFLPSAILCGLVMRRKGSRAGAIGAVCGGFGISALFVFGISLFAIYGRINADALKQLSTDYLIPLKNDIVDQLYRNLYTSLEQTMTQMNMAGEIDLVSYTAAYIKALKPVTIGLILASAGVFAYLFTEVAKQATKWVDSDKLVALPGIKGKWEYILSKGTATAFIIAYVCMFLGGDALKFNELAAFNAVIMAITGGVLIMAFRAIKDRISKRGWADLVFPVIILVFFLSDYIFSILAIIGLVASFRFKSEDEQKCKK